MEELEIKNLDHFGRGIAKEGKPVFIANALPNEIVKAKITKEKKNYMEGIVTEYIKKSKDRIEPICPYFNECGGCDLMHISYNNQLLFKENKVKEIMKKFLNYDNIKPIVYNKEINYRNKITLQVKESIGYYKKKSYEIIPIDNCLLGSIEINSIIKRLKNINLKNINQIVIRTTKKEKMLVFYISGNIDEKIIDTFKDIDSIVTIGDEEKVIYGKNNIEEEINGIKFVISPTSFFQVNINVMQKLYGKVIEYAKIDSNDVTLDLYCGTGTIGIWASKYAKKVLGIEINDSAIKDAFINKKLNNIDNIDFKVGDVPRVLNNTKIEPTTIFVDPPRSGLDNKTIELLLKINAKKIVYVSCDPVTLARDLNSLKDNYNILEITPFDMFPNTYHVETVSILQKK